VTKLFVVAWWEYSEKIKSKAFIISLVLLPAVVAGLVLIPAVFASRAETQERHLGIIDETGLYGPTFSSMLNGRYSLPDGNPAFRAEEFPPGTGGGFIPAVTLVDSLVLTGHLEGYFILRSPGGTLVDVEYRTRNTGNVRIQEKVLPVLREAVTTVKLRQEGVDPDLVAGFGNSVRLRTFSLSAGGIATETAFEKTFFSVYLYMMMLFFIVITSGQLLVRSVLEEKSGRIVELLLSSVTSDEIMGGKILGLGGLGLTQMFVWGGFAAVVSRLSGLSIIPPGNAAVLAVFFVLGYLLYAAIFVAAGAPLSTEQEAQQVTSLFSLGLIVPLGLSFTVMQDPGSAVSMALTLIPFFTPMMMAIRIPVDMPPLAEIVTSMVLLGISVYAVMRLAGKVFSASVLLTGKRLTIREIRALIRAS